ncbi:MAG: type II toxin-antitoxin system HicA family toxin [Candidatus Uhrbacteria bacterium]
MPPKLILKYREIIQRLKALGFVEDHIVGSHVVFYHSKTGKRAVVPKHAKELAKGTVKSIIRESGLDVQDFLQG